MPRTGLSDSRSSRSRCRCGLSVGGTAPTVKAVPRDGLGGAAGAPTAVAVAVAVGRCDEEEEGEGGLKRALVLRRWGEDGGSGRAAVPRCCGDLRCVGWEGANDVACVDAGAEAEGSEGEKPNAVDEANDEAGC